MRTLPSKVPGRPDTPVTPLVEALVHESMKRHRAFCLKHPPVVRTIQKFGVKDPKWIYDTYLMEIAAEHEDAANKDRVRAYRTLTNQS